MLHKVNVENDLFSSIAICVKITQKKCLKWWDSGIVCFEPNSFDLVSLYSRIHNIVMSMQLQVHINRYSKLIRTAELNSIANWQTLLLKKEKDLRPPSFHVREEEFSVFFFQTIVEILFPYFLCFLFRGLKKTKKDFWSRLAILFFLPLCMLQTFLLCQINSWV